MFKACSFEELSFAESAKLFARSDIVLHEQHNLHDMQPLLTKMCV